MTEQEAIKVFEMMKKLQPRIFERNSMCEKAVNMAIQVFEYRTPKKPKVVNRIRGGFRNHTCAECGHTEQKDERYEIKEIYCSVCGKIVDGTFRHYCGNCGQAIDRT